MRLAVIAVGRLKDGPERELCERYRERGLALGREPDDGSLQHIHLVGEMREGRCRRIGLGRRE